MKLLEIIELRTAAGNTAPVEDFLRDWIRESGKGARIVRSYRHVNIETDYCIHLNYISDTNYSGMSSAGRQLADACKEFGLVNHSTWVEHDFNGENGNYEKRND